MGSPSPQAAARLSGSTCGDSTRYVRTVLDATGAGCSVPLVRTIARRLVRVARTYSTEARGRTCQHRAVRAPRRSVTVENDPHVLLLLAKQAQLCVGVGRARSAAPLGLGLQHPSARGGRVNLGLKIRPGRCRVTAERGAELGAIDNFAHAEEHGDRAARGCAHRGKRWRGHAHCVEDSSTEN